MQLILGQFQHYTLSSEHSQECSLSVESGGRLKHSQVWPSPKTYMNREMSSLKACVLDPLPDRTHTNILQCLLPACMVIPIDDIINIQKAFGR